MSVAASSPWWRRITGLKLFVFAVISNSLVAPVRASGESLSRPLVQPFDSFVHVRHLPRRPHCSKTSWFPARGTRDVSPWPRAKARHMVQMQQLRNSASFVQSRASWLSAGHRAGIRLIIDIDQLLRAPGVDAHSGHDFGATTALGIPIISGVPPIIIITPVQRERHPFDAVTHRRTR